MRSFLVMVLLAGSQTVAMAGVGSGPGPSAAPEIGAGSAAGAFALLSGSLLVIRGRRRK